MFIAINFFLGTAFVTSHKTEYVMFSFSFVSRQNYPLLFSSLTHWLPVGYFLVFPSGLDGKESTCNSEDLDFIPRSGRSPDKGNDYILQFLAWRIPWTEEPDRWQSMGSQSQTYLNDYEFSCFPLVIDFQLHISVVRKDVWQKLIQCFKFKNKIKEKEKNNTRCLIWS